MLNIFRKASTDGKSDTITFSYNAEVLDYADKKIYKEAIDTIVERITKDWIDAFGAELLKQITPQEVEERVKQELAKKVLNA